MQTASGWEDLCREIPEWFRDAKFGLFFHWGPYSIPAYKNEWYSRNMYDKGSDQHKWHVAHYGALSDFGYKDFIPLLKGESFNPEEWAELTLRSGAKYGGPVTEHADNYSLWDSRVNPVNSVSTGPGRDITGECAASFRRRGLKFLATFHHQWLWGWFMSTDPEADCYLPENERFYGPAVPYEAKRQAPCRMPDAAFNATWAAKVREVVEKYRPDMVYFDSRACIISEGARREVLQDYYRRHAELGGIISHKHSDFPPGIGIYDAEVGISDLAWHDHPWQFDDHLEDNETWCIVQEPKYRNAGYIVRELCDIAAKNGCLLLNVGPCADGSIHPDAVTQLHAVGDWLRTCGEAIYATRPWRVAGEGPATDLRYGKAASEDFRFTAKGETLYAIALGWPQDGIWRISSLSGADVARVGLVGGGELPFRQETDGLEVTAPQARPYGHAWPLRITLAREGV